MIKGSKHASETIEKIRKISTGRKLSQETKRKLSLVHMGRKKKPFSEEHKKNIGLARKGVKHSKETKIKIGLANKGEKSHLWKGGISTYERKLYLNNRRRVLKINASGSHTLGEWQNLKAQYNWTCPCCIKSEPEIVLTEDHIIPLSKGGSDNIENIQPLCRNCNSRKYTKIIKY